MNISEEVKTWIQLKKESEQAVAKEREARSKLTASILSDKVEGSRTDVLGNYKLSATAILNYSIDKDLFKALESEMTQADWSCIEFKPMVKPSAFKKLSESSVVHRFVKVTPGVAQLKLVEYLGEDNDD